MVLKGIEYEVGNVIVGGLGGNWLREFKVGEEVFSWERKRFLYIRDRWYKKD